MYNYDLTKKKIQNQKYKKVNKSVPFDVCIPYITYNDTCN